MVFTFGSKNWTEADNPEQWGEKHPQKHPQTNPQPIHPPGFAGRLWFKKNEIFWKKCALGLSNHCQRHRYANPADIDKPDFTI
jgi:hypothetical protein